LPLKTLKIQKSKLYLSELKQVFALEGLTVLSLMYTQVILDADLAIPTSSSLETLDLMGFGGDKALLYALIKAAPNLKMLDLFNAKVPDLSENELGRFRQLERLDVREAKISVESLGILIKAAPKIYSVKQDKISKKELKKIMNR